MGLLKKLFSSEEQYGQECRTIAGEKVKSRSEKTIADYLFQNSIRYEYEKAAKAHFLIFSEKISKPDFYLSDYNVYVEYWGLVDADDKKVRSRYTREMKWKMAQYHKHKIKFISLYESNLHNLDWIFRKKYQEVTGNLLPSAIAKINYQSNQTDQQRNFCKSCGSRLRAHSAALGRQRRVLARSPGMPFQVLAS